MDYLLWWLLLLSAALSGAVAAVWLVSYLVEERFSVRRVRGTAERPEETTLELYWSRGGVCVYHRVRDGKDDCFAPYARQYLDRGWFFHRPPYPQKPHFNYAGGAARYPLLGFSAGRSRSEPGDPIEWRGASFVVPCWFLVLAFSLPALAWWRWEGIGGGRVALSAAAGFLLAIVPLGLSARRGRRISKEISRRLRDHTIEKALRAGRVEVGMTMEQVTQVLAGWSGRRTHTVGRPGVWEMWEFRRDDAVRGPEPQQEPISVFFRNGQVALSTQRRNSGGTALAAEGDFDVDDGSTPPEVSR